MHNKKLIISWLLVIIWASFIFLFSNMDSKESSAKSGKVVGIIIETGEKLNIIDKQTEEERKILSLKMSYPIRKTAHVIEYLILAILLVVALKNSNVKGKKNILITILICFLYACSDEFHQTFIDGRGGMFKDALIDTFGSLIGIGIMILRKKIYLKK